MCRKNALGRGLEGPEPIYKIAVAASMRACD